MKPGDTISGNQVKEDVREKHMLPADSVFTIRAIEATDEPDLFRVWLNNPDGTNAGMIWSDYITENAESN